MPRLRVASWSSSKVSGQSVGSVMGRSKQQRTAGVYRRLSDSLLSWKRRDLAVARQELHHVVKTEAAVAPLADAEEWQLAAVAQALDRIDVQVKQVCYFTGRQHRPELVDSH